MQLFRTIALITIGTAPLAAQGIAPIAADAPPAASKWEAAGAVGAGFRSERGRTIGGARFEGTFRRAWHRADSSWLEFGAALAQVTAHRGAAGDGANVNENSVEFFARLDHAFLRRGSWALTGSIGPALAVSTGCTAGGDFAGDVAGYGNASCTNAFAEKGKVRPGITARLTNEFRAPLR